MSPISKTENFDADRGTLLRRFEEYEKRWIKIFESFNTGVIAPSSFESLEQELQSEFLKLKYDLAIAGASGFLKSREEYLTFVNKLDNSRNKINSYAAKARALTTSKWKDKNRDVFQKFLEFITELLKYARKAVGG